MIAQDESLALANDAQENENVNSFESETETLVCSMSCLVYTVKHG